MEPAFRESGKELLRAYLANRALFSAKTVQAGKRTPIYPVEILPDWAAPLMQYNPMYHYVSYFRDLILSGTVPGFQENLLCLGMAVAAFVIGLAIFKKTEKKFILYV